MDSNGINVLSLFDGISCGRVALERAGIQVNNYFSSEIDKNAIKCSSSNWPDIIQIGDVNTVYYLDGQLYSEKGNYKVEIDLIIGGSPCQSFSSGLGVTGKEITGLSGKSKLFYQYLRILNEVRKDNPDVKWILENVKMAKKSKQQLDNYLNVCGVYINSQDFSFQKRPRYYWTNLEIKEWEPKNISFQDYLEKENVHSYKVKETPSRLRMWSDGINEFSSHKVCANVTRLDKINCVTTNQDRCPNSGLIEYDGFCRYLSQTEIEAAQTLPRGYTSMLSYRRAVAVIGNGWTVDVIAHIMSGLKEIIENSACDDLKSVYTKPYQERNTQQEDLYEQL